MTLPEGLEAIVRDEEQLALLRDLASDELGQSHLFDAFREAVGPTAAAAAARDGVQRLANQLTRLDGAYPGGLRQYVAAARALLRDSRDGVNPLAGFVPSIPEGEKFELGTVKYRNTEKVGIKMLGTVGFVLVAGGLGERLGYTGAKIGLPTESTTGTLYLQYYAEYIRAVERKVVGREKFLPLCIMVSNDTKQPTMQLLKENKCFGLRRRQIYIVQQGDGVPALTDGMARFEMDSKDPFKVVTKPHGHGDIHSLLYKEGVTREWEQKLGIKYIVFFQDTNGLAFHTLPLMLGVSENRGFIMNSLCVPRKAKQAIGGLAKLKNASTGEERTVNVEYNQLDPLLRSTEEFKDGDVNDATGYSPFPGNINQIVFKLNAYNKVLDRTKGIMPDFVNPKYKNDAKTVFKKPTRLECMMQDFPTVLEAGETKRVGFTQAAAEICFSPVKNNLADGVALQDDGIAAGTAATGEADQYAAMRIMLRSRGCHIEDAEPVVYNRIKVVPGPAIVLKPDFACCPGELNIKFPTPEKVKISARSTLVIRGPGVTIESLDLDGCLIIDVDRGETAVVRDLKVSNEGWIQKPDSTSADEVIRMRGFVIDRRDARYVEVHTKAGEIDNTDDTSVTEDVAYEVEDSYCGVNFGGSTKPCDDSGPACVMM